MDAHLANAVANWRNVAWISIFEPVNSQHDTHASLAIAQIAEPNREFISSLDDWHL
jgi:hypothetical protein